MLQVSKVKIITPESEAEIAYMDEVCFPADERIEPATQLSHRWIARDHPGGYLAGYLAIELNEHEKIGIISRVGVLPVYRGRKLQIRMQSVAAAWARRNGWVAIATYTVAYNHNSSNNLAASGFKIYTPIVPWAGSANVIYWYRSCQ